MPGKPAARLTDMTAHGGTITGPGVPTVLIGKMPAATLGDMHVCPMVTPGVPPIPHVGGPITLGSTGVFIGKKPAARVGDMAVCVGPPSSVVLGCFTVMIGEAGSGSQAGSAAAAAAAASTSTSGVKKVEAIKFEKQEASPTEAYEIQAVVKDKGGKPIPGVRYRIEDPDGKIIKGATAADGSILHGGFSKKGSFKLVIVAFGEIKFSKDPLPIDTETTISAQVDADDGTAGHYFLNLVGHDGSRLFVDQLAANVSGKKLEAKWTLTADRWRSLFEMNKDLTVAGVEAIAMAEEAIAISKVVPLDLSYDITVKDHKGQALADQEVEIAQPDGQMKKVKTDGSGKVKLKASAGARAKFASHPKEASK